MVQTETKVRIGDNVCTTSTVRENAEASSFTQAVMTEATVEVLWPQNLLPNFAVLPAG